MYVFFLFPVSLSAELLSQTGLVSDWFKFFFNLLLTSSTAASDCVSGDEASFDSSTPRSWDPAAHFQLLL